MKNLPVFKNLVSMTSERATQHADKQLTTFLSETGDTEGQLTFASLDDAARKIAAGLVAQGLQGRNLMMLYLPGIDYIKSFFGCLYAGAVPVPAYPPMGARDLARLKSVVTDCDAGAMLTTSTLLPLLQGWLANPATGIDAPALTTDTLESTESANGFTPYDAEPDDLAFLQYTSGSTGHPKGVMVSHNNLITNFRQIAWNFLDQPADLDVAATNNSATIWLPPFHDMGLIGGILTPVYVGMETTLMAPTTFLRNPYLWLKTLSDNRSTISGGPNFCYQYCVKKITEEQQATLDFSNWRVAFNGAEPIQADTLKAFADKFADQGFKYQYFQPCYGLAEASLMVTGTHVRHGVNVTAIDKNSLTQGKLVLQPDADIFAKETDTLVSSGALAEETDVRIVNPKTHEECKADEVGEIWVSSPSVASGYWNKPTFSDSVFRASLANDDSGKTFMRTGDLGVMNNGELYVTGRIKELIIIAGRNHYPQDIERTLQASNPSFRKGCGAAFSITEKSKEQLVIVQEIANPAGAQIDYDMLAAASSRAVAAAHGITPHAIVFISPSSLPKTSSGKIQRTEAKRNFEDGKFTFLHEWEAPVQKATKTEQLLSQDDSEFTDWGSELLKDVQNWLGEKLQIEAHLVDVDVTFSELGVDSVEAIDLLDLLQYRIKRDIPATEMMRHPTVRSLINHLAEEATNTDHSEGLENASSRKTPETVS